MASRPEQPKAGGDEREVVRTLLAASHPHQQVVASFTGPHLSAVAFGAGLRREVLGRVVDGGRVRGKPPVPRTPPQPGSHRLEVRVGGGDGEVAVALLAGEPADVRPDGVCVDLGEGLDVVLGVYPTRELVEDAVGVAGVPSGAVVGPDAFRVDVRLASVGEVGLTG